MQAFFAYGEHGDAWLRIVARVGQRDFGTDVNRRDD